MIFLIRQLYSSLGFYLLPILMAASFTLGPLGQAQTPDAGSNLYLPIVRNSLPARLVNIPYYSDVNITNTRFKDMAIFWFGRVRLDENSIDVRIAYNDEALWVYLALFDRSLWYDPSPSPDDLANWDAARLFLDLNPSPAGSPGGQSFQFLAQLTPFPDAAQRANYQRSFIGQGGVWQPVDLDFETVSGWRGDAVNTNLDDRGWVLTYIIPFESLGLAGPPSTGTLWRMGLQVLDRDNGTGSMSPAQKWPENLSVDQPNTWGQAHYGLAVYSPPSSTPGGTIQIRHRLDGAVVEDASAGGYALCGEGTDFWSEWGETTERFYNPEATDYNIQNQADVADWPCFSKVYLRFPLAAIPPGKVIRQARLIMDQFGQAGAPGEAPASNIQALVVSPGWDDPTLTWNNAPMAEENVSQARVDPILTFPGWPGVAREWDLSYAVARAYANSEAYLNLALYSADGGYHSGKYFVTSDTGEWNAVGRPTLEVVWGEP